ncbi:MAG: HNH endonuclease [Nitratireductor sp.]
MPWSPSDVTQLISYWLQGLPAQAISKKLEGKSRNAVLSKAKRIGIYNTKVRSITAPARVGQAQFRREVLSAYANRCAVTGSEQIEILEAAHIVPHSVGKDNDLNNGICLRSDIHSLFDCGLLSISENYTILIAHSVTDEYYTGLADLPLSMPVSAYNKPNPTSIAWHRQNVFRT